MFTIETKRCILRPFELADAPDLYEMDRDPLVHKYLGNKPLTKIEQAVRCINIIQDHYTKNGMGRLKVIDKKTNEFLGWSGIKYEEQVRSYPYYDIGYRFKVSAWGKGYATETAMAAVSHGFSELDLFKICGAADVNNIASNRVLLKIGMSYTKQFEFDGNIHNWYEILK